MYIDFGDMTPQQVYITMTQTVIPRPIAWVLSENADGSLNLAPYSYFNAVSSDPALVMISAGVKPDGGIKDTRDNIRDRRDFVIHITSLDQLDNMNASSASFDPGVSEVDQLAFDSADRGLPPAAACRCAGGLCLQPLRHPLYRGGPAVTHFGRGPRLVCGRQRCSRRCQRSTKNPGRQDQPGRKIGCQ